MRKSRFTEAQIIEVLKQAESGTKVADLAPERGVRARRLGAQRARRALAGARRVGAAEPAPSTERRRTGVVQRIASGYQSAVDRGPR